MFSSCSHVTCQSLAACSLQSSSSDRPREYNYLGAWMDVWTICDFTSFSTVFQSYHDDIRVSMKSCLQCNVLTFEKISPRAGLELGTARSVGQRLTHIII